MKVFISWSGPLSCKLAEILNRWIRGVLQAVQPFYSPDMDRGIRWSSELAKELEETHVGLICLTRDNLESRWIMFEAGALSKTMDKMRLCPILFNLSPSDVERPLSDFNLTTFDKSGIRKILATINRVLIETEATGALDEKTLDVVFEKWWPDLEREVSAELQANAPVEEVKLRSDRDLLEELLQVVRVMSQGIDKREPELNPAMSQRINEKVQNREIKSPSATGTLKLQFVDVYGERPDDIIDVTLKHDTLGHAAQKNGFRSTHLLQITGLDSTEGTYIVLAFPTKYQPVSRFIRVSEGKTTNFTLVLPVDPDKVAKAIFPTYEELGTDIQNVLQHSNIEGYAGKSGKGLYDALDDLRKAALLNTYTKMKRITFTDRRDGFSYVESLTYLSPQRFFAKIRHELLDEVKNSIASNLFREVPGLLHSPPVGFTLSHSFKTLEKYGNLQLTFFSNPETLEFVIDADIDDAGGIEHIFQVIDRSQVSRNTHPYEVHQILVGYQRIDPGYQLIV
jgi:hypothetical protein